MIALVVLIVILAASLTALGYLLGFRLGSTEMQSELVRVRAEAAAATRQMHDLTRHAFVAMAEEAERRRIR